MGIGKGLSTKINASIGTSTDIGAEVRKAVAAQKAGTDTLMELSVGSASLVAWMKTNGKENPLYEKFDRVVGILKKIGAAQSARYGADLICYITPAEHLALPNEQDVIEGAKVARVAAHIGDLAKPNTGF